MEILIAEDDPTNRLVLTGNLKKWGYDVVVTNDGAEAWEALRQKGAPQLAILDWMMPEMDGPDICRLVRDSPDLRHLYLILLTARGEEDDLVEGLQAGADDYVSKPFRPKELQARLQVGLRVVGLQARLAERVRELQAALAREEQLQDLLPICSYCKKIRDDRDYWTQVEQYIETYANVALSHGICPDCFEAHVKPEIERFKAQNSPGFHASEAPVGTAKASDEESAPNEDRAAGA